MTQQPKDFPQRPHSHIVGGTAVNAFNFKRPQDWNVNESTTDYGWDIYVEIPEDGSMTGLSFFLQLKGSDNPDYVEDNKQISFPLRVTTINFLMSKAAPPMKPLSLSHPGFWII